MNHANNNHGIVLIWLVLLIYTILIIYFTVKPLFLFLRNKGGFPRSMNAIKDTFTQDEKKEFERLRRMRRHVVTYGTGIILFLTILISIINYYILRA